MIGEAPCLCLAHLCFLVFPGTFHTYAQVGSLNFCSLGSSGGVQWTEELLMIVLWITAMWPVGPARGLHEACIPPHPLPATVSLASSGKPPCLSDGHCLPFPHSAQVHAGGALPPTEPAFLPCCCCFCCSPLPPTVFLKTGFHDKFCNFYCYVSHFYSRFFFYKLARKSNQILLYYLVFIKL